MKAKYLLFLVSIILFWSENTRGQCSGGTSFASVAAPTGTVATQISTCNFAGDYNTISSVVAGRTYTLTASPTACITIHSGSPTGPVVAYGTSPVSFTASTAGTYYMTINTNCTSCGTASTCITTTITCNSCGTAGPCSGGTAFASVAAPTGTVATQISTCNFAGDYNTISSVVAGSTYTLTASPTACITIHSGSPTGPAVAYGMSPVSFTAPTAGTYYMTINTNCTGCGTASTCITTTITCNSCGTTGPCSGGTAFASAIAPTGAVATQISTCNYAGDYNTISSIVTGSIYTLTANPASCITIHSGSPTGPVVAYGMSPVSFTAPIAGTYYMTINTNCTGCGTASTCITTAISGMTPLGLETINLTGKNESGYNVLQWISSSEFNADKYVVERSGDGINYTEIGFVKAKGLSTELGYQFEDLQPADNIAYYRIRLIRNNGSSASSNIIAVERQFAKDVEIVKAYPNPATEDLTIILASKTESAYQLTLSNLNGQKVFDGNQDVQKGLTYTSIDVSDFRSGFYLLTVSQHGKNIATHKIIIE